VVSGLLKDSGFWDTQILIPGITMLNWKWKYWHRHALLQ